MEKDAGWEGGGKTYLKVPTVPRRRLDRNYLKSVVCELRFPTLIEVDRAAIDGFRKVMRKTLPVYGAPQEVRFSPMGESTEREVHHQFQTKHRDWSFTFKPDALVLESTRYTSFEDMERLLREIVAHAAPIIDADFFTRVGLRYINAIPVVNNERERLAEWINPALVGPLADGIYGSVTHYIQDVRGKIPEGGYRFRNGIGPGSAAGRPEYLLDFDFYAEGVEIPDVYARLTSFADYSFSFFLWALGPRARQQLHAPAPK